MENKKNNSGVIALLIVIIVILLALCVLFATGTISFNSNRVNNEDANQNVVDNNSAENITTRTYRFFGYNYNAGPDMYTTLKLYSNGKYDYYINECSAIGKFSGSYTETEDKISLFGKITTIFSGDISFKKINNGNTLEFNFNNPSCSETGGSFSLESYMLGD